MCTAVKDGRVALSRDRLIHLRSGGPVLVYPYGQKFSKVKPPSQIFKSVHVYTFEALGSGNPQKSQKSQKLLGGLRRVLAEQPRSCPGSF